MQDGGWVERGTGVLKLNATKDGDKSGARLGESSRVTSLRLPPLTRRLSVMRADATHRLLLNSTLFSKFSIEVNQEKYVRFAIIEGGEPISYMLRVRLLFPPLNERANAELTYSAALWTGQRTEFGAGRAESCCSAVR